MIATPGRGCRLLACALAVSLVIPAACSRDAAIEKTESAGGDTIVVFTTIANNIIAPLFDMYSAQTGSSIILRHGELHMLTARQIEKDQPEPDLFIADDIADLTRAAEQNVLRPTRSALISGRIPLELRDPEHLWISLSTRARTVVYNSNTISESELQSIADYTSLAHAYWRGRLCLSSSTVPGNASLIARLINDLGVRETEKVVRGWRVNLARFVFADDTQVLQAIAAGECAIGIADSSQLARFRGTNARTSIAPYRFSAAGVTHVDSSGGGVTRHARNPEGAASLLEWLTSGEANSSFAAALLEFPANPQASVDVALAHWSGFDPATVNVAALGYLLKDAAQLAERARYP